MSKEEAEEIFSKYIMLKGLLNKIDYVANSGLKVEYKNNFLEKSIKYGKFFTKYIEKI